MSLALLFCASFVFIFLKAWQQRNVAFNHYWWVLPTSFCMAFVEVFVIVEVASQGFGHTLWLTVGAGSGLGALCAMWTHRRCLGERR